MLRAVARISVVSSALQRFLNNAACASEPSAPKLDETLAAAKDEAMQQGVSESACNAVIDTVLSYSSAFNSIEKGTDVHDEDKKEYFPQEPLESTEQQDSGEGINDLSPVEAELNQPELELSLAEYLGRVVTPDRIKRCVDELVEHEHLLDAIEQQYSVDRAVIVALWCIESSCGDTTGSYCTANTLAHLATTSAGGRSSLFFHELVNVCILIVVGALHPRDKLLCFKGRIKQFLFSFWFCVCSVCASWTRAT